MASRQFLAPRLRPRTCAALVLAAAALLPRAAAASGAAFEGTIRVPRTAEAPLGWTAAGCTLRAVSLRNYPSAEDISRARRENPEDKSWVWWDFHVENRSASPCEIRVSVDVYDRAGRIVKSSDRTDTVDEHRMDDDIRVSTRMRTLDIVDSPKAHLRAEIGRKN
ncbi:MAG: hypothetical protein ABI592_10765 [Acidobacteriota bacterium]